MRLRVAVAVVEPEEPVGPEHAADLAEDLDHGIDVCLDARLKPELPLHSVGSERPVGRGGYDRLQAVLLAGGFDGFVEETCRPYYAARMGAPSVPPGRTFRVHLVGAFQGIDSERGLTAAISAGHLFRGAASRFVFRDIASRALSSSRSRIRYDGGPST